MRVKKYRTVNLYEIGKMESYLSDMAKEGLFLKGMSQCYNIFKKKQPADMEYRIELGGTVLKEEMLELYKLSGWSHTCSYRGIHIFQAPASDALVEIHTDPQEQSFTLKKTCRKLIYLICVEVLFLLLTCGLTYYATRIGDTPVLNLLENDFTPLANLLIMILIVYEIGKQLMLLIRTRQRLRKGYPINHHEVWRKRSISNLAIYGITAGIVILIFTSLISSIINITDDLTGKSSTELTFNTKLQAVRLNDIEKLNKPVMRTDILKNSKHSRSNISVSNNLFVKEKDINEEFLQNDTTWQGEDYSPSLSTKYYRIDLPFMVSPVLTDVLQEAKDYFVEIQNSKEKIEKLNYQGLDEVYYVPSSMNDKNYFALVVRKGNVILWMIYRGQQTRSEVIKASQALFES